MNKYSVTEKTAVKTENCNIQPDNYTSIELTNIGDDDAVVNNNIPLKAGDKYSFINEPYVTIAQSTELSFADIDPNKKVLVRTIFYKKED